MKVKFVKDIEYDSYVIWVMLHGEDPYGAENRAKSMGINKKLFESIYGTEDYEKIEDELIKVVKEKHEELKKRIDKAIKTYQKSWDKINDIFSTEIEMITKRKWNHKTYEVVVSPFHPGVTSRGGDRVAISAFENADEQKRITAHEILMSHIWTILFDKYPKARNDDLQHFWALNEITTTAILGLEPQLNKLWREKEQGYDQYLGNYQQLKELQSKLKEIYLNKKDFDDYLNKAILLLDSKYKNISFTYKKSKTITN